MGVRRFGYACFIAAAVLAAAALGWIHLPAPSSQSEAVVHADFNPANATTTPGYYSVVRVIDGDTLVAWKDDEEVTVRLLGMDTPEVVDPRKPVECFGPEASAEGKKLLTGQDVRLVADPSQDEYDMYGRMLAYVYLPSGLFYNEWMIEEGYAHEYTFKTAYEFQKQFRQAQAEAKAAERGFWSPSTCGGNTGVDSSPSKTAE